MIKWTKKRATIKLIIFFMACICVIYGAKVVIGQPPEDWVSGIRCDVVPSAKITKVSFYFGKTEAGEMLIYEIGIKNVSSRPVRFKLTLYPLKGDPVSGFYPLAAKKGKPLALEPNEQLISKWPVFSKEFPQGFALVVKEAE